MDKDKNQTDYNNSSSSAQENIVNESEAVYQNKQITSFASFDEMENDQLQYFASLSPEELLRNNKKLSMGAFGINEDEGSIKADRKIKFKRE